MSNDAELSAKIQAAIKWSTITEVIAKMIAPLTNVALARLLSPESFGIVATVTMVISFAEMIADAGFQKYLIQKDFPSDKELYANADVAFWANLVLASALWFILSVFSQPIAGMIGAPEYSFLLIIAGISLPLISISSIQMALYRRALEFKVLFYVRLAGILAPVFVTIPMAYFGFGYWALIIGTIAGHIVNGISLTVFSKWRPRPLFSIKKLYEMFSFSMWSVVEAFVIWLGKWADIFILGNIFSDYYLGLYKTSSATMLSIFHIITMPLFPVFFSALSRLKDDQKQFINVLYGTQFILALIAFPLGVGIFVYRDIVTGVLLGAQWTEAMNIIGLKALSFCLQIGLYNIYSEVYRAKGKPNMSFWAQSAFLCFLVPSIYFAALEGFWTFIYIRQLLVLVFVFIHFFIVRVFFKIPLWPTIKTTFFISISTVIMGIAGSFLRTYSLSFLWQVLSVFICIAIYASVLLLFPSIRNRLKRLLIYKSTRYNLFEIDNGESGGYSMEKIGDANTN